MPTSEAAMAAIARPSAPGCVGGAGCAGGAGGGRGALLVRRGARNDEPDALVHVQRESAAIKACAIRTAEVVRGADE